MENKIPELYLILYERIVGKYRAGTVVNINNLRRFISMVGRVPGNRINKVLHEMCEYGLIDMNNPVNYELKKCDWL